VVVVIIFAVAIVANIFTASAALTKAALDVFVASSSSLALSLFLLLP
jgi:hypothetical protein